MHYKDVLLQTVKNINSNNNKLVNVYIPGKSNMRMIYSVDRHKDLFSFYEIDVDQINFEYSTTNDNWVEQSEIAFNEPNNKKVIFYSFYQIQQYLRMKFCQIFEGCGSVK